jgi:PPK2 family polyphosphate:nucleotide phosphotransferase
MKLWTRVEPDKKVRLSKIDPGGPAGIDKAAGVQKLEELGAELNELQELLYAAGTHSALIVLQGMDTSGKDGAIRHVMKFVNPQGCRVESFKVPSADELAHDFLWRVHRVTPPLGMMSVFNRSHYEDVIVVRVRDILPEQVWSQRYEQINNFEALLAASNTIVVKLFLHISKDEQEERLLAREKEAEKAWKLAISDWEQRPFWDEYQSAYEDALQKCSTRAAPWYVVPANRKWLRNLAVAGILIDTLKPYKDQWKSTLAERSALRTTELQEYRAQARK